MEYNLFKNERTDFPKRVSILKYKIPIVFSNEFS